MTFEQICKENYSRIFKYIYAITCDRECAENLTQEVFYIALKKEIPSCHWIHRKRFCTKLQKI